MIGGIVEVEFRIITIDRQIRDLGISGIRRIEDGYLIPVLPEKHRHHFQCFVMFHGHFLGVSLIQPSRDVLISAKERRCGKIRMSSVGDRVRIVGEAVKLLLELRLFFEKIGNQRSDRTVEHQYNDILAFPG